MVLSFHFNGVLSTLIIFITLLTSSSLCQLDFTSDGCVDPSGFDSCMNTANNIAADLFHKYCSDGDCTDLNNCYTSDPNCATEVTCVAYTSWINCALKSCWNRVNGCEYQNLAIQAFMNCPLAIKLAPYVPAPHNAPGYCSCNMGYAYAVYLRSIQEHTTCTKNIGDEQAENNSPCYPYCYKDQTICNCCQDSSGVSAFFNTCPTTDPSQIIFFPRLGYAHLQSPNCVTNLTSDVSCAADPFDYTIPPGPDYNGSAASDTFYIADTLPQNGTDTLSNNPGGLTSPTLGVTLTWGWIKGSSTVVTAVLTGTGSMASASASASASAAAGTTSMGVGNGGSSQTMTVGAGGGSSETNIAGSSETTTAGSTAGSGTTSPAATTTTKSGATRLRDNVSATWIVPILAFITGQFL